MTLSFLAIVGCRDSAVPEPSPGDPCAEPGAICTWVGEPGVAAFSDDGLDRTAFRLYLTIDVEPGADGSLFLPDYNNNHRVVKVGADDRVEVLAGTGFSGDGPDPASDCWDGCEMAGYRFDHPSAVIPDPTDPDIAWVSAWRNSRIVRLDLASGTATWWAGSGERGYAVGDRTEIVTDKPSSIAVDPATGDLYFTDAVNHLIRVIHPDGTVDDLAGHPRDPGFGGDGCPADQAWLHTTGGTQTSASGRLVLSDRTLYFADTANGVIRTIDLDTRTIGTVAGRYEGGAQNYTLVNGYPIPTGESAPGYQGDGGAALDALLARPLDVAIGPDRSLYIADTDNNCVRRVDPWTGRVETFAGQCTVEGYGGDEGPATDAVFSMPSGVSVDGEGNVFVADTANQVIRRIAAVYPPDPSAPPIVPPVTACEE